LHILRKENVKDALYATISPVRQSGRHRDFSIQSGLPIQTTAWHSTDIVQSGLNERPLSSGGKGAARILIETGPVRTAMPETGFDRLELVFAKDGESVTGLTALTDVPA
jgi:hypothetical protein